MVADCDLNQQYWTSCNTYEDIRAMSLCSHWTNAVQTVPSIGEIQWLHETKMNQKGSHAYLLLVGGFYDDASLRMLQENTEDIFRVGKVTDSPLKAGLCVFTHECRLWKQIAFKVFLWEESKTKSNQINQEYILENRFFLNIIIKSKHREKWI